MILKRGLQADIQGQLSALLVNIDSVHQHPQVGLRQLALFQDIVHHANVPFQPGLPAAECRLNILQLLNPLLRRGNFCLPLLNHAVVSLCVGLVPNPLHENGLHFLFQPGGLLRQLFDLCRCGGGLGPPLFDQLLHGLKIGLIHPLRPEQFLCDQLIQHVLIHSVGGAVLFPVAVVGITAVLHPLAAF